LRALSDLGSEPVGEDEVDEAGGPVGIEFVVADFVFAVFFAGVVAPVGLGAVEVGEAVFAGEGPGAEDAAGFFGGVGIGGEGDDGAADEARGFGDHEVAGGVVLVVTVFIFIFIFVLLSGVFPVGFSNFEVFENSFGTEKSGGEGDGDNVAFAEFAGHGEGEADDGNFDEVVEEVAAVVEGVAVGDFEDDGGRAAGLAASEHERDGKVGGDDVGVDGLLEHVQAVVEVDGPKCFGPFGKRVASPDVVDEDIEAFMLALDEGGEFFDFGGDGVIDADGDAAAAGGGDEVGGLFDGFRVDGILLRIFSGAAAGAVDGGSGFAEGDGDAASGAAGGSGDEGDFVVEGLIWELRREFGGKFCHGIALGADNSKKKEPGRDVAIRVKV
jgi:hypothetical protein